MNFFIFFRDQKPNKRKVHHELKKMSLADRKKLAKELMEEVQLEELGQELKHPFQDSDFENPFNICPPAFSNKVFA